MTRPGTVGSVGSVGTLRTQGFLLVALAGVLWGTGGLAGSLVAQSSDVAWLAIASLRLVGGGLAMLAFALATGAFRGLALRRDVVVRIVATGVLSAIYQGAYFLAVSYAGVALATVVALGSAPVIVAITLALRHRRLPSRPTTAALALAVVGLVLLSGTAALGETGERAMIGVALALVSGASFAATTLLNARRVPGLTPAAMIGPAFTLAGLLLAPLGVAAGAHLGTMPPSAWLWLGYLALVPTAGAYLAYYTGLPRIPATTAAVLSLLEPVTAAVVAVLVLDERLTPLGILGMGALLVAVALLRPGAGSGSGEEPAEVRVLSPDDAR